MSFGSKEKFKGISLSSSSESKMNTNKEKEKTLAQYGVDAELLAEFEQSSDYGKSFDYSKNVLDPPRLVSEEKMIAYLSRIQRGGFIQPFGCMVVIEESTFRIIGYSENCFHLLADIGSEHFVGLIGVDATTLFTPPSGASLVKAVASREISRLNPIWVHARTTGKPFYAILHRIDVGVVIDLEPARSSGPALSLSGTFQSQKMAVSAISRLQSCRGEDISLLCDTVVEEVQKLTGYDRVMIYKFHEDDHGEVVSEIRRSDLEPYLGLHYPAIDIPQAARFLFKQNRVRLISDCHAKPVKVIHSHELKQPLCLVNSTLRSPHDCHKQYMANMGSIASLVMAVVVNGNDGNDTTRLWGLLVCHHTSPHHVSFPVRHACEFVVKTFGMQLYMEIQLASQMAEKRILKTQTMLCDMLLRDAPFGIVTQSPSIMDLVKCDGAALYYDEKCWLLGITPTKLQVKDIAEWLHSNYGDSTGLTTESLVDAGYPGATLLGDAVCGMASARINPRHILFWFRSHTAKEIKWGGAKHHPADKDDGGKMNPRTSFKVFLEVVKSKSLPWEISEINAIHSLQLIMRDSFQDTDSSGPKTLKDFEKGDAPIGGSHEISSIALEMVRLIETAAVPIFGVDLDGLINGWNVKIAQLTGLQTSEAMGKSLANEVVHVDSRETLTIILRRAFQGQDNKNVEVKINRSLLHQEKEVVYLMVSSCTSRDYTNAIVGVCFVGQDITFEKEVLNKLIKLEGDYKAIMQSLNPLIPPIFASDENACCSEWNAAMESVTGWKKDEVIGKMLLGEIFGSFCRLKGQDALTDFMILLYRGISGQDSEKSPFGFYDRNGEFIETYITTNKREDAGGDIIGCFCFLQIVTEDFNQPSQGHRSKCRERISESKELSYILQEMKSPLNGILFTHKLLENTDISENQKQILDTSEACERQIMAIIQDTELGSINEGTWQLNIEEFLLGNILDAIVSQVMMLIKGKDLQLFHEIPGEIQTLSLYGDQIRLQMVLSDILRNIASHTPAPNGWVEMKISPGSKIIQDGNEFIHLKFRMTHSGQGLPSAVLHDMFYGENQWTTQEGLGLYMSRKILSRMNGDVQYVREQNKCYFLIDIELRTRKERQRNLKTETSMLSRRDVEGHL